MRESRRVVSFSLQKVQTDNAKKYRNPTKNALYSTVNALNTQPSHKDFINLLNFPYQSAGVITLLINRKENPMVITFIDGIYNVSAESKDRTELIKEMSLAINMLAEEADGDYKPSTFDNKGGRTELS